MTRVQTTLKGSADDIGWLQKMPNALPVEDDTVGFLEALEIIRFKKLTFFFLILSFHRAVSVGDLNWSYLNLSCCIIQSLKY